MCVFGTAKNRSLYVPFGFHGRGLGLFNYLK
jgi:hypothetical protein